MDALMGRLLIAGDSFASSQLSHGRGWPDQLAKIYQVTNIARPGIGEYKILRSLLDQTVENFDHIIVCHTSPYRLHCESNPLYPVGHIYKHSDVIFADAESKAESSSAARRVVDYFKDIYDPEYQKFVHNHCCREIDQLTNGCSVIHLTFFGWYDFYRFPALLELVDIWQCHPGDICHLDIQGNNRVAKILLDLLDTRGLDNDQIRS